MQSVLHASAKRRLPVIHQSEAAECGLACLAMIAGYHGFDTDLRSLRQRLPTSSRGVSVKAILQMASTLGLGGRAVRCELEEIGDLRLPAVLHWRGNHFVVLRAVSSRRIVIHDPAIGARTLSWAEASKLFTGVAVELTPTPQFQQRRERNPLRLSSLVKFTPEIWNALRQAVALSIVIELMMLATPLYMQIVIDSVVVGGDAALLNIIALAFTAVLAFNALSTLFRSLTLQFTASILSYDMQSRLFHHLLRLPLDWFGRRHVGDVQSRFRAVAPIQQFLSNGALTAIFDGILAIAVLCVMIAYSAPLALIVVAGVLALLLIRLGTVQISRAVAADYLVAEAREQSGLLETLRAAETIKAGAAEATRETSQRNAIARTINAGIKSANVSIVLGSAKQAAAGLTDILVIYFGALLVLDQKLSVGMLTAFVAYKAVCMARCASLIEQLIAWRLLDVQLDRIADIALSPVEPNSAGQGYDGPIQGALSCRNTTYFYSPGEPPAIAGVVLDIQPGEFVAITGESGAGKTTLLKLMAGLYQPTLGQVFLDGRPIQEWSSSALRTQIGVVSQSDTLLAGSIADNIAFFDEHLDMPRVVECARIASIAQDILRMPMQFNTLVGDMGASLSGGQVQRILIARALYKRPKMLLMDEGTAHLDLENEQAINAALKALTITRVIVAHRPETVAAADRQINLSTSRNSAAVAA